MLLESFWSPHASEGIFDFAVYCDLYSDRRNKWPLDLALNDGEYTTNFFIEYFDCLIQVF